MGLINYSEKVGQVIISSEYGRFVTMSAESGYHQERDQMWMCEGHLDPF